LTAYDNPEFVTLPSRRRRRLSPENVRRKELTTAIRSANEGSRFCIHPWQKRFCSVAHPADKITSEKPDVLSEREFQVLQKGAEGSVTNKSRPCCPSDRGQCKPLRNIFDKLGVYSVRKQLFIV